MRDCAARCVRARPARRWSTSRPTTTSALTRDPRVVAGGRRCDPHLGRGIDRLATGDRLDAGARRTRGDGSRDFVGAEAALVFSSGYLANLGAVTALAAEGDLVVSDASNHASIVDACRLSRGTRRDRPASRHGSSRGTLADRDEQRAVVVTDAVFSVDGDAAPLRDLHEACIRHGAVLVVDEAHALGVVGAGGRGLAADSGLAGAPDVVLTVTLSKALGSQGGAVLGSAR